MKNSIFFGFYPILDLNYIAENQIKTIALSFLNAGVKVIEIKGISASKSTLLKSVKTVLELKESYNFKLIIYGNPDIVKIADIDGIHLDQGDLPIDVIRGYIPNKIIGKGCYSFEDVIEAEKNGVDYITIGPVFISESKHIGDHKIVGLNLLKKVSKNVKVPVIAFGGINLSNISSIISTGITGVTLASDILKDSSPLLKAKAVISLFEGRFAEKKILIIDHSKEITSQLIEYLTTNFRGIFSYEVVSTVENIDRSTKYSSVIYALDRKKISRMIPFSAVYQRLGVKKRDIIVAINSVSNLFRSLVPDYHCLAILDIRDSAQFNILDLILQSIIKK